jgi:protein-S-isoprenylcysteine O-methyltransferase Ste14
VPVQSSTASFVEALANVILGFVLALAVQSVAYPLFGIETTLQEDGAIAILFTVASLLRSWCWRRLFVAIERHRWRQEQERRARLERRLATGRLKQASRS